MISARSTLLLGVILALGTGVGLGCKKESDATRPAPSAASTAAKKPTPRTAVLRTKELPIDRIYHSMQGPFDRVYVDFDDLDWVTGIRTDVVDLNTNEPIGGEFFCHSQVQLLNGTRLLTMATGADELRFPEGFAMPISAIVEGQPEPHKALTYLGMVLNNHEQQIDRQTRVNATMEYFRDEDFGDGPRPKKLYMTSMLMEVENLEEYKPGADEPPISDDVTTHCALVEQPLGGKLKLHWMVPPGKQITRKRYESFLPIDGTVHFAWAHLHNYGVYMRLTDVTTGKVLFQANVENEPDRDQIANISQYSSAEGFQLYKDHVYEIEAAYDNTTDQDVDAMAMMVLYYNPEGDRVIRYRAAAN